MNLIREKILFAEAFIKEFKDTGSLFATTKFAALALCRPLIDASNNSANKPKRVLEVGPGTGSVTRQIIKHLGPEDELLCCEINKKLLDTLQESLEGNPYYERNKERIHFFHGPVQDLPEEVKYDYIISAIPFLNLDPEVVKEILEKYSRITCGDKVVTYYEYSGIRALTLQFARGPRQRRFKQLDEYYQDLHQKYLIHKKQVKKNIPPIMVYTLSFQGN